ncbi:MAG TPA: biotin--[acetyl-CoA-carboxylase] ligase [Pirellulaceae bacterium]|nr:biotin--[acetyl-CoA-carboxylase] ligase [Pirellulaceae bacterium]
MFDVTRIQRSGLVARVDFHESLGSTSDWALKLAAAGESPLPLLVLAEKQTDGRGRGTNRWWSADGALTFSLIMEASPESLAPNRWPQISLSAGLAVCEMLEEFLPRHDCRIKWPNDVFVGDRKICGILCESAPGWRDRIVLGIGLNVNNSLAHAPLEVRQTAVSLIDAAGGAYDRTGVLLSLLDRFEQRWRQLIAGQFVDQTAAFRQRCFLTGKMLTIVCGSKTHVGRCQGIDDAGELLLQTESGLGRFVAGTIVVCE